MIFNIESIWLKYSPITRNSGSNFSSKWLNFLGQNDSIFSFSVGWWQWHATRLIGQSEDKIEKMKQNYVINCYLLVLRTGCHIDISWVINFWHRCYIRILERNDLKICNKHRYWNEKGPYISILLSYELWCWLQDYVNNYSAS